MLEKTNVNAHITLFWTGVIILLILGWFGIYPLSSANDSRKSSGTVWVDEYNDDSSWVP